MKKHLVPYFALFVLVACQTPQGNTVLVDAQKTIVQAKLTMDAFVHLEYQYKTQLAAIDPKIHQWAETVRAHGQQWLQDGWTAVEVYRTSGDKTNMEKALAVLQTATNTSQQYINQAKAKGIGQ